MELPTETALDAATCHMNLNHNHTKNLQQAFQHKPVAKSLEEMLRKKWHALTVKTRSSEKPLSANKAQRHLQRKAVPRPVEADRLKLARHHRHRNHQQTGRPEARTEGSEWCERGEK